MELRKYNNKKFSETTAETIEELDKLKNEKLKPEKSNSSNIHKNHRARLKTQFLLNGISALTDVQKLELLLFYAIPQKDTNPLAHALINHFGSLKNVMKADYASLTKISGVKENTATFITLVNSILNHCNMPDLGVKIDGYQDAIALAEKCFFNVDVEQFYVFCLSKSNKVTRHVLINSGTNDEVDVQIRHISKIAIENKCNRIIVAHNHPDGPARMSDEDCAFTYCLICSCVLNNIDVVDHIIVGTDKSISLGNQGHLQRIKANAVKNMKISDDKKAFLSASSELYKIK